MIPTLAQTTPDASALKSFIEVAFYLVGGITAVTVLVNQFRGQKSEITNNPLEVKQHPGSVTRDELKQVHGRIERERHEIDNQIAQVREDAEKRMDKFDSKLDANTAMTSEMRGEVRQIGQTVGKLEQSLSNYLQSQINR